MSWPWIQQALEATAGAAAILYIICVCRARGGKIETLESKLRNKDREIEILRQMMSGSDEDDDEQS